jgi:hypothetical protein
MVKHDDHSVDDEVLTMVMKEEQGATLWSSRQRYFGRVYFW